MEQQVIIGDNKVNELKDILTTGGHGKPFIIIGEHLRNQQPVLFPFDYHVYFKKKADVFQQEIDECFAIFIASKASAIIAAGGGSSIDLAKAIIYNTISQGLPLPFFICIPTTAGSGSEVTQFAVIYKNNIKFSLDTERLLPAAVILDPQLTHSLSPRQTAVSAIDAFAQAIESHWNINATDTSKKFSAEAISLLLTNLPAAYNNPTAIAREKTMWAAHLSGKAINITRTTGPHALSYYLTANYNIPHGQAVALFLPLFFLYNSNANKANFNPAGIEKTGSSLREIYTLLKVNDANEAAAFIQQFIKSVGLATKLDAFGIDKFEVIEPLLNNINEQRFNNNPVLFNRDLLKTYCLNNL